MAPLDFPSNPVNGTTYNNYVWDSSVGAWLAQGSTNNVGDQIAGLQAKFPVSVANGGTGATTVAGAQSSLSIAALQILNSSFSVAIGNSSSTYADTGLSVTITPASTSSKIALFATHMGCIKYPGNSNSALNVQLLRGSSSLLESINNGFTGTSSDNRFGNVDLVYVDSPSTTSAVTYKTQFKNAYNGYGVVIGSGSLVAIEVRA